MENINQYLNFKKEKSCGAVVYRLINNQYSFLLIKSKAGSHWSFPKGHVENNETEEETALREIKEETGLDVILNANFRKIVTYSPKIGVIKDVIYFLALEKSNKKIINQEAEVADSGWFLYNEALSQITFESEKKLFIEAYQFLNNYGY